MKRIVNILFSLLVAMAASGAGHGSFEAGKGEFLLDGKPFVVKAAELHYPRIPREYWDHRIKMCKALGMNTVCLYVFWNVHEEQPDRFDFTGQNDLREFVKLCGDNDMKVILRPGPYVCAEWEMGGLPWWLLRNKEIRLREQDPYFLDRVDKFQRAVAGEVADLTVDKGGPIIMIQVENEYGSYGTDKGYISEIRDMLRRNFGDKVTMFQCDWSSNFLENGLDDLVWTLNFGTGADIEAQFAPLRAARPDAPLMCSEFWSGWFDKWGASHETRPADEMVAGIGEMLSKGISFSLYMTHGGTNRGHWAGANSPGYAPDVTSYDYDAPISENGGVTPKYEALRALLAQYAEGELPPVPQAIPVVAVEPFELTEVAELWQNLPEAKCDTALRTMEEYNQGFGSIVYTTELPELKNPAVLRIDEAHDFAQIFVDGNYIGKLDRRNRERELTLPPCREGARLDILVEAMGRINFGRAIKDFKGIVGEVKLDGRKPGDWKVFNLPDSLEFYTGMTFRPLGEVNKVDGRLPRGVYRGRFNVERPADTFLNFESWGKGLVYVNGYPLGRIWQIGPQQTLYTPGCWLREGENEIVVFDIIGPRNASVEGLTQPIVDKVVADANPGLAAEDIDFASLNPVAEGVFTAGGGWKRADFDAPAVGRYLCIEAVDAADGGNIAAIAEVYLIDVGGKRLPRELWSGAGADSQDAAANRTVDKTFDLQESTYWASAADKQFPHYIIIDLGREETVAAVELLPRVESGAPGAVGKYRIYLSPTPFAGK